MPRPEVKKAMTFRIASGLHRAIRRKAAAEDLKIEEVVTKALEKDLVKYVVVHTNKKEREPHGN